MENKLLHTTDILLLSQLDNCILKIHEKKQKADQKASSFSLILQAEVNIN